MLSPHEWSFCGRSSQPKPPRSHYDHVTCSLVLNMDHFCPWMANCVGYLNYRYFLNFLLYVQLAMFYAVVLTYGLFVKASQRQRRRGKLRGTMGEGLAGARGFPKAEGVMMTRDEKGQVSC